MPTAIPGPTALLPIPPVPILEPDTLDGVKEHGKSKPLSMFCKSANSENNGSSVVNVYNDLPLKNAGLAREIYGSLLGQCLGFDIPSVAVINIPADYYRSVWEQPLADRLKHSPGLNFGSRTRETNLLNPLPVPQSHLQQAADVFAFDMIIQNPNRRLEKPNLFQTNAGYMLFDHEEALIYARPDIVVGGIPEPWDLRILAPRHLFIGS